MQASFAIKKPIKLDPVMVAAWQRQIGVTKFCLVFSKNGRKYGHENITTIYQLADPAWC